MAAASRRADPCSPYPSPAALRFVLPCALVIINDIMAYFAGKVFGRTPLIKLSPKKTLEGYVGGGTLTVLLSIPLSDAFSQYEWMTCSRTSFAKENLECLNTLAFEPAVYHLSDFIPSILRQCVGSFVDLSFFAFTDYSFVAKPIVVHGIFLALFASSIAPFGGFFASGIKRALKIKDFGDSIPGHGGLTDRMDCQCVMGVFAYVYVNNFVKNPVASMSYILDKVSRLLFLLLQVLYSYALEGKGTDFETPSSPCSAHRFSC